MSPQKTTSTIKPQKAVQHSGKVAEKEDEKVVATKPVKPVQKPAGKVVEKTPKKKDPKDTQYKQRDPELPDDKTTAKARKSIEKGIETKAGIRKKLRVLLFQHVCKVVFFKVNGHKRIMRCTLMPKYIKKYGRGYTKDYGSSRRPIPGLHPVIDVEKKGWRSFYDKRIVSVEILPDDKEY